MKVSKNNFFVKFAYFHRENANALGDFVVEFFVFVIRFISLFLPIMQIYKAVITRYYTDEELKDKGLTLGAGYYRKRINNRRKT